MTIHDRYLKLKGALSALTLILACAYLTGCTDGGKQPVSPSADITPSAEMHPRHRVIVSTDIGGTDPDDFQSMAHLFLYTNEMDLEGLISSPFGPGRKQDILDVIQYYEQDYPALKAISDNYPTPAALRHMTKQGETEVSPYKGYRTGTEGSDWIIQRARIDDPRPLHILIWGGIEDLAQALHDAPDILPKLRVYYIGGPNKKWGPNAYQYIVENYPKLFIIESNATYRGWFVGGNQAGDLGNTTFVSEHVAGHGALGNFFITQLGGEIKMGDSPSLGWILSGDTQDPSKPGWGGQYVKAWTRADKVFTRLTSAKDSIEEFSILELKLPVEVAKEDNPHAQMIIENQALDGYFDTKGHVHFRFSPKAARTYDYRFTSNIESLDGLSGAITALPTSPEQAKHPDNHWPNWWIDNPAPEFAEGPHIGAKSVSQWREDYLKDFAARLEHLKSPRPKPLK